MTTLSECKARIRRARQLMRDLRAQVNACSFQRFPVGINLPLDDFEVLEWGMGHLLKQWLHELDAEGEVIPGRGKLIRLRGTYTRDDGTVNFMFKGIPVRCDEPHGCVFETAR